MSTNSHKNEPSSNKNRPTELVDYSVPSIVSQKFTQNDLEIVFAKETENLSEIQEPTTEDDKLNFFVRIMERGHDLLTHLPKSWTSSPLDTLKLIAYLRDCRQGKGNRAQYQICLYWLYKNHPKTLANNLEHLASFGYWKDLLHFLLMIFFYGEVPYYLAEDDCSPKAKEKSRKRRQLRLNEIEMKARQLNPGCKSKNAKGQLKLEKYDAMNTRVFNNLILKNLPKMDKGFELKRPFEFLPKKDRRELTLKFARFRLESDVKYRYFHILIAEIFAKQLIKDKKAIGKNEMTLAAKWAPSVTNHFDKYTLIGTTIGNLIVEFENLDLGMEKNYESVRAFLCRKIYHKEYLSPLRQGIAEVLISQGGELDYGKLSGLCIGRNSGFFMKNDKERFEDFLAGKNRKGLKVSEFMKTVGEILSVIKHGGEILELEDKLNLLISGLNRNIGNSLIIPNVSEGEPLIIALTLIALKFSNPPWNEICICCEEICKIPSEDSLVEKIKKIINLPISTDVGKILDLVIKMNELPRTIFVLTDKEFAFGSINLEEIKTKFTKHGLQMPRLVYWNLKGNKTNFPTLVNGTIQLNGYSDQLFKLVLENEDLAQMVPLNLMKSVLGNYDVLGIFD